jgi:hypothetical protein
MRARPRPNIGVTRSIAAFRETMPPGSRSKAGCGHAQSMYQEQSVEWVLVEMTCFITIYEIHVLFQETVGRFDNEHTRDLSGVISTENTVHHFLRMLRCGFQEMRTPIGCS